MPIIPKRQPGEFTQSDFGFLTAMRGSDVLSPSTVFGRRSEPMPRQVTVGTETHDLADIPVVDYSREFWFEYFRKEAFTRLQSAPPADKAALLAFFNKAFVRPDSFRADLSDHRYVIPRGPFERIFVSPEDNNILRNALRALLNLGFSSIEAGASGQAVVSNQALANRVAVVDKATPDMFRLVWRGSERSWENVRQHGSAAAARFEPDALRWNMREPWHPLSDPAIRNRIHFRNTQNDNCLFTTVSVTDDWKCALCYPKIEQNSDFLGIRQALAAGRSLEAQYRSAPPGRIGKVTFGAGGLGRVEYRMVSVTRIAVLVLDGLVVDTGRAQQDYNPDARYPEYGTHSVAGSNVFGMLEYVRLFHGPTDDDGFTAYHVPAGTRLVTEAEVLAAFGDARAVVDYFPKIVSAVTEARVNRLGLKWIPTGTEEIKPPLDYWRRIEFANGTVLSR